MAEKERKEPVAPALSPKQLKILRKRASEDSKKIAAYIYKKNDGPYTVRPYSR